MHIKRILQIATPEGSWTWRGAHFAARSLWSPLGRDDLLPHPWGRFDEPADVHLPRVIDQGKGQRVRDVGGSRRCGVGGRWEVGGGRWEVGGGRWR